MSCLLPSMGLVSIDDFIVAHLLHPCVSYYLHHNHDAVCLLRFTILASIMFVAPISMNYHLQAVKREEEWSKRDHTAGRAPHPTLSIPHNS